MKNNIHLSGLQMEIILLLIFSLIVSGSGAYYMANMPNEHPGIIRLHVVANSNSDEDQQLKLQVRNEILKHLEKQETIGKMESYIEENLQVIESLAEETVHDNGYDYPVKADLKVRFIPEKSYEDLTLPPGNYEALDVTIGSGNGHNWWCVIYPQLCLIGKKKGKEKLILKSKIKEIIKKASGSM